MPLPAQQLRDDYQHDGDLDEALLRWHEAKLASCDVGDFDALEVAVIDYLVALALGSEPGAHGDVRLRARAGGGGGEIGVQPDALVGSSWQARNCGRLIPLPVAGVTTTLTVWE
jgi:hypothetical protein